MNYRVRRSKIINGAILTLLLLSSVASAIPSEQWNRTYGGKGEDWASSIQQTSDGGYVVAGRYTSRTTFSYFDAWLLKIDANGNKEWDKTFGGTIDDWANSIGLTMDGGYILAGGTGSYGAGSDINAYIIKTDANGTQQWYKKFGGEKDDWVNSIQQTSDGGYIIAGRYSYGKDNFDAWLIKTDANGSEQWSKIFGEDEEANSVQQTIDGGFIVVGKTRIYKKFSSNTFVQPRIDTDAFLIKTDGSGEQKWRKTFGGTHEDSVNSVRQTSDGGFVLIGYTRSYGDGGSDAWLIKTDSKGNEEWNRRKTFGGTGEDMAYSVQQTSDGGYIIAGSTELYETGKPDMWIFKTDSNGSLQWSKILGGKESDRVNSVQQTRDGGYILAGVTYSYGNRSADGWIIRLSGDSGATPLVTPISTSTPTMTITPVTTGSSTSIPEPTRTPLATTTSAMPGFEVILSIISAFTIIYLLKKK